MPKFCANLSWLFTELDVLSRFAAAKDYGFEAVELLNPYDSSAQDLFDRLIRTGQQLTLFNCPPPNYTGGLRGFAAVEGSEARFQQDFKRSLRYASKLKPLFVHVMAGEAEGEGAKARFVENMKYAADLEPKQNLTIEPLNPHDAPEYFLNDYYQARDLLAEIDKPNVFLQFDAYHVHRIHGDVLAVWNDLRDIVGHVQISAALDRDGYNGWVSCEYKPKVETGAGLSWMQS